MRELLVVVLMTMITCLVAAQRDVADASPYAMDESDSSPVLSFRLDSDAVSKWPMYNDFFIAAVNSVRWLMNPPCVLVSSKL
jgi:hypothetical protein